MGFRRQRHAYGGERKCASRRDKATRRKCQLRAEFDGITTGNTTGLSVSYHPSLGIVVTRTRTRNHRPKLPICSSELHPIRSLFSAAQPTSLVVPLACRFGCCFSFRLFSFSLQRVLVHRCCSRMNRKYPDLLVSLSHSGLVQPFRVRRGSTAEMAPPQRDKLKLFIKAKEARLAESSQRPAEGLPYASILKGYYGICSLLALL